MVRIRSGASPTPCAGSRWLGAAHGSREEKPDQTALELLVEFQARYPGEHSSRQLHTLQKRVRAWRQQAIQRLISGIGEAPECTTTGAPGLGSG